MVGYAGSRTYTAYVDMTLTRSKVKVTGLLNFRQLAKPCMLAAMTAAPLRGFLVSEVVSLYFIFLFVFFARERNFILYFAMYVQCDQEIVGCEKKI